MLDHPITVVLNVFRHWKATGLKVSKFMCIQNPEEHIGHGKQVERDRYQDRKFLSQVGLRIDQIFRYNMCIDTK